VSVTDVSFSLTVADTAPITTGARAVVTIDGATYVFDPEAGDELGVYYDPAGEFAQRNVVCTLPDMPDFRAYYRPDVEGDREEWVFEYADPFDAAPVNLGAYVVEIVRNDGVLIAVDVPQHFWLSRWRWQSEPRAVRRTPQELAHEKLLPHFDGSVIARYAKTHAPQVYTPMTLAGLMGNQQTTGERPDIGIVTDWQADYLCVTEGLGTILAQAEAAGTFNIHVRATIGAPMDLFEWPTASMYNHAQSNPYIVRTACDVNGAKIVYDTQHSPALAYVPWLLTGDPYYLEELQFQANADVLMQPPSSRWRLNGRGLAWGLRNALYAWAATPEAVPDWLLPRGYWAQHIDEYRAYGFEKANTPDNVLHLISSGGSQATPGWPAGSYCSPWQEDFLLAVFALAVRLGRAEWTEALLWKLDCTLARVASDVWHQPNPSPYQISTIYACALAAAVETTDNTITVDNWGVIDPWPPLPFDAMVRDEPVTVTDMVDNIWAVTRTKPKAHSVGHPVTGPGFADWAECYARNLAAHPEIFPVNAAGDPDALYTGKTSPYVAYSRGALALVVGEEVAGADDAVPAYEWIDGEFVRSVSSSWKPAARKWAIQPGPADSTLAADLRLILVAVLRALAKVRRRGE
jgi:hypothetical protein